MKERVDYELVMRYFKLMDGVLYRKEYISKDGKTMKTKVVKTTPNPSHGYLDVGVNGKKLLYHRIIFMLHHNRPIQAGFQIDHINGVRLDNRIENLREVTNQQNHLNRRKHREGHLGGTSYCKINKKFISRMTLNGRQINLGYFKDAITAHTQRLKAERFIELNPELLPHLTPAMLRNFINE